MEEMLTEMDHEIDLVENWNRDVLVLTGEEFFGENPQFENSPHVVEEIELMTFLNMESNWIRLPPPFLHVDDDNRYIGDPYNEHGRYTHYPFNNFNLLDF